jgi:DNA invertase Pin-like site-specific DNA recombinase
MANVGYIRVSSADQNTARQLDGVQLDKTFIEKVSGATADREQLHAMFDYVREGDTVHVHEISRLARS